MKPKLIELLEEFNLDNDEAKIYLALLELGNATVAEIAQKSGVKRTSIYFMLDKLKKVGLVYQTNIDTKSFYTAEKPEKLLEQYKEKIKKLHSSLDELNALSHKGAKKPKVLFFDSEEGFRRIWQTLFDSGENEYLIITDPREMLHFVRKNYITGKIIRKKIKLGISSRQLVTHSEYAKEIVAKDKHENRVSKILPQSYRVRYTTIIFGDRVALISPFTENIIMLFESPAFAQSERAKFDIIWELLPAYRRKHSQG
ncbi:MAG: Sugar-specific transcriptional regulator TrmB [bacterium ADurb.Bin400]|nr:MAG: Sugar-specific transcriptional regulator TrmB [bacterium ADurb.Bin400]